MFESWNWLNIYYQVEFVVCLCVRTTFFFLSFVCVFVLGKKKKKVLPTIKATWVVTYFMIGKRQSTYSYTVVSSLPYFEDSPNRKELGTIWNVFEEDTILWGGHHLISIMVDILVVCGGSFATSNSSNILRELLTMADLVWRTPPCRTSFRCFFIP